jgi:hypothetical protein
MGACLTETGPEIRVLATGAADLLTPAVLCLAPKAGAADGWDTGSWDGIPPCNAPVHTEEDIGE